MIKALKIVGIVILGLFGLLILIGFFASDDDTSTSIGGTKKITSVDNEANNINQDSINNEILKKKEQSKKMLNSFKKNKDEFEGTTFYRDPRTPYYSDVNFIYPYIGEKEGRYWMRLKFQYTADDWLFINKAIFLIDGETFNVYGNWERDHDSKIWEWLDIQVDAEEEIILEKLAESKSAKIRYIGNQYRNDRAITSKEKSIIKKTLEIYKALN